MATVNGFTAERMLAMEAATIVGGAVNGSGHLILTKHDASTVDAGAVIGPTGSPGVTQPQLDTFMNDHLPIGSSVEYIGTTSPSVKWLLGTGQTIVNGRTTYPAFWAIIPAGMKHANGNDIIMPDTRGKVAVGYDATQTEFDTIGEVGGAKVHNLTTAELPASGVVINPPATTVSVNPPATAVTGRSELIGQTHDHSPEGSVGSFVCQTFSGPNAINITSGSGATVFSVPSVSDAYLEHDHGPGSYAVDIAPFNVSVDIAPFTSPNLGSGSAMSLLQPYITMQRLIKVA